MKILFISRSTLFSQPGGDTLQIEETAHYLKRMGHLVDIKLKGHTFDVTNYDVVHFFNLFRPADILPYIKKIKCLVVTAIYVDYTEYDSLYRGPVFKWTYRMFGKFGVEFIKAVSRWLGGNEAYPGASYMFMGQRRSIAKVLKQTDFLITASHEERNTLIREFPSAKDIPYERIMLGIEHFTSSGNSEEKKEKVICAARIEGIKNQLNLIKAGNLLSYPLELYGKVTANQPDYLVKCQKAAGPNIYFKGQANKDQLSLAFAESKVHAMPSFFETTGLSTLEALSSGCQVVISRRGGQEEIFAGHAHFCEPTDPASIKNAIEEAMHSGEDHRKWVHANFSWQQSARRIAEIYQNLMAKK